VSLRVSIKKRLSADFRLELEHETAGDSLCLGILGASGSGKTMTLKCIAGIETPDEGHISVNGRVLFDSSKKINLRPRERRVGYLFQNYALFPRMTTLENIRIGLPRPGREEKVRFWIGAMGLTGLEDRLPSRLSGGQQQRAALARMLIRDPDVLLLDEPFSALDSGLREQMQLLLLDLIQRGSSSPFRAGRPPPAAVMVTHSRDEAYKICDSVLIMENGRVFGRGRTKELFANPRSLQAARITGCKNISPIRRVGEREILALHWGFRLTLPLPVPEDITHAGIRAHDFFPLNDNAGEKPDAGKPDGEKPGDEKPNQIRIRVKRRSEEPFEEVILFTNAAAASPAEENEMWWKFSKYPGLGELPRRLYVPPEAVLLLK
jgi:molybdate transport system ATP-binding protein